MREQRERSQTDADGWPSWHGRMRGGLGIPLLAMLCCIGATAEFSAFLPMNFNGSIRSEVVPNLSSDLDLRLLFQGFLNSYEYNISGILSKSDPRPWLLKLGSPHGHRRGRRQLPCQ